MTKAVILSACRTPGGKYGGSLKSFEAPDLGGVAIAEAVKRSGVKTDDISEVIMKWLAGRCRSQSRSYRYGQGKITARYSVIYRE